MLNVIDVVIPVLLLVTTVWGFSTGYWQALVVCIALLIGVVIAAHFDISLAAFVMRLVASPGPEVVQALVFVVLTTAVTLVALGIVSWLLSFARPTTRAARSLPSAHVLGAVFGFVFGILLSSVVLMTVWLGTSGALPGQVTAAANLRNAIDQAAVAPPIWRVTHVTDRLLSRALGPNPPPFNVP